MEFVAFSDLHGHLYRRISPELYSDGSTLRLREICGVVDQIVTYCEKHEIRLVLFGGDLNHMKSVLNVVVLNYLLEAMARFNLHGIEVIGIPGNHDLAVRSGLSHSLTPFEEEITVINKPGWVFRDNLAIYCVPFQEDGSKIPELLKQALKAEERDAFYLKEVDYKIAMVHQFLDELMFKHHRTSGLGDYDLDDLPLDKFDLILSGHHHIHDQIFNYVNIGSPIQHSFNDVGSDKGFVHVKMNSKEPEVIHVHTLAPEFIKMKHGDRGMVKKIKGNFVRVQIDKPLTNKVRELYTKLEPRLLRFESVEEEIGETEEIKTSSLAPNDILVEYIKETGVPKGLDPEAITKLGLEILSEVA
jgi:DNA repair exonuclease SbcCD nuclease subunit